MTNLSKYDKLAADFVAAVKTIASKPDNLDNLESYLSHHFGEWLETYAATPEDMTAELRMFAELDI